MGDRVGDRTFIGEAAEHATRRVPTAGSGDSVAQVRGALAGSSYDCADEVAVLDGSGLVGLVPLRRLLRDGGGAKVADLMDTDPPVLSPGASEERVAWTMVRRGEPGAAVVDAEGSFVGLIPSHRMLGLLLRAHDEDMARLGGYLAKHGACPASPPRSRWAVAFGIGCRGSSWD